MWHLRAFLVGQNLLQCWQEYPSDWRCFASTWLVSVAWYLVTKPQSLQPQLPSYCFTILCFIASFSSSEQKMSIDTKQINLVENHMFGPELYECTRLWCIRWACLVAKCLWQRGQLTPSCWTCLASTWLTMFCLCFDVCSHLAHWNPASILKYSPLIRLSNSRNCPWWPESVEEVFHFFSNCGKIYIRWCLLMWLPSAQRFVEIWPQYGQACSIFSRWRASMCFCMFCLVLHTCSQSVHLNSPLPTVTIFKFTTSMILWYSTFPGRIAIKTWQSG